MQDTPLEFDEPTAIKFLNISRQIRELLQPFLIQGTPIPGNVASQVRNLGASADVLVGGNALDYASILQLSLEQIITSLGEPLGNAPPYPVHYAAEIARSNGVVVLRAKTEPNGQYSLFVPRDGELKAVHFFDPLTKSYGRAMPYVRPGAPYALPRLILGPIDSRFSDFDSDGLPDVVEFVFGTDPTNPDSDGDGVKDGAEVDQGTDSGQVAAVDLASGTVLALSSLPSAVQDVGLGSDYLYALTSDTLHTFSILDGDLQLTSSVTSPTFAAGNRRLFVGSGTAYAVQNKGVNTFSLADPTQPAVLTADETTQFGWKQIVANGSGLGVAAVDQNLALDGPNDISLYDLRDTNSPPGFVTTFPTPGIAFAASIYNGLAYVADGVAGMHVINYFAYDSKGQAPTIRLESSFPLSTATNGTSDEGRFVRVTASVTDDAQVRNVEFFIDGQRAVTDGNFPFDHRFVTPPITATKTNFSIKAKATDTGGNFSWSDEITVALAKDATPPRVVRALPSANSVASELTDTVLVFFSKPIDQTTLNSGAFQLFSPGPDNVFGTADDLVISGGAVSYRDSINAAVMSFSAPLPLGTYAGLISSNINDLAGHPMTQEFRWTFAILKGGENGGDDGDDLTNAQEVALGTNPLIRDSDVDGWMDNEEVVAETDPLNPSSHPPSFVIVGTPPVNADVPSPDTAGPESSPFVLGQPPVDIQLPKSGSPGPQAAARPIASPAVRLGPMKSRTGLQDSNRESNR